MRCTCPSCQTYRIQAETKAAACICPECGSQCTACLGTNTLVSREKLQEIKKGEATLPFQAIYETGDATDEEL